MKTAAIWWRVSTEDQRETSPDTQISEALAMAQEEGYTVPSENILGAGTGKSPTARWLKSWSFYRPGLKKSRYSVPSRGLRTG